MSKITPEHLARQAVVYIRQSTADQGANNLESSAASTIYRIARDSSAGVMSPSSTMISAAPAAGSRRPVSRSYWPPSAKGGSAW